MWQNFIAELTRTMNEIVQSVARFLPRFLEMLAIVVVGLAIALLLKYLLRAVLRAQIRCDLAEEAASIAALLADPDGLRLPEDACRAALPGGSGAELIRFHTREAWFPARAHALWFLAQMRRWGWLDEQTDLEALAVQVYRPDLLASAVEAEGLYPAADLPALEGTAMLAMPNDDAFAPQTLGRR